jgi:hypothetical protein
MVQFTRRRAATVILILMSCAAVAVIGEVLLRAQQQMLFTVTSPAEGQVFRPGDSIEVRIDPSPAVTLEWISIWSPLGFVGSSDASQPISLKAPDKLGSLKMLIIGGPNVDEVGSQAVERTIVIESDSVDSITVSPIGTELVAPGTGGPFGKLTQERIFVTGYIGGQVVDMSRSSTVTFASTNTRVATVDAAGLVRSVAPGLAEVVATHGTAKAVTQVLVNVFELQGDLDGDSDVDQADINLIVAARNSQATGAGDPRDTTNDGMIDALDSRALVNLCSRPRCVTN